MILTRNGIITGFGRAVRFAKLLILWRTQEDSNLWPLPSEGYEGGCIHRLAPVRSCFSPVQTGPKRGKRDLNGILEPEMKGGSDG